MRITNVRAIQPETPDSPDDWRTSLGQILVAVDTDRGLTGYGMGGGGLAAVHIVETVLRDCLLGKRSDEIDELWQQMYTATLAFGRKGVAIMALSGVDLALWDLRGRVAGCSVARLLEDKPARKLPVYRTVWGEITQDMVRSCGAFKLHVERSDGGDRADQVAQAVERTRARIGDSRLMIDAWMRWDVPLTLDVAARIAEFDVEWIEEPLSPDDLDGYQQLAKGCSIPIAGGEHEFTEIGFRPLIEQRLHQVLQPDICWCGGLTQVQRIAAQAAAAGLKVCLHRGAELWGLQAIAGLKLEPLAESGRPWMSWLGGQPRIENGQIEVPDRPGFGVQIDESSLRAVPFSGRQALA